VQTNVITLKLILPIFFSILIAQTPFGKNFKAYYQNISQNMKTAYFNKNGARRELRIWLSETNFLKNQISNQQSLNITKWQQLILLVKRFMTGL
jgi:hypothetical protein